MPQDADEISFTQADFNRWMATQLSVLKGIAIGRELVTESEWNRLETLCGAVLDQNDAEERERSLEANPQPRPVK